MNLYIKVMNTYTYIIIINSFKRRVQREYISFVFLTNWTEQRKKIKLVTHK